MKVQHDIQHSRFVIPLKNGEAELVYAVIGDAIDLQHTEVPPSDRNQGIADKLVRLALAYAREAELRVIPKLSVRSGLVHETSGGAAALGG